MAIVCFMACSKEDVVFEKQAENEVELKGKSVLAFDSKKQFKTVIDEVSQKKVDLESVQDCYLSGGTIFISSLAKDIPSSLKSLEEEEAETIADSLVPNENHRGLLNEDLEVIVNDTLYRITPEGTYFCHVDYSEELRYIANNEEKPFLDKFKEDDFANIAVSANVTLIQTYKKQYINGETFNSSTKSASVDPYSDVSNYKYAAKTVVGKAWSHFFGRNKYHNRYLGKKRRFGLNLYSYNYGYYEEAGVRARFQKKSWSGWKKTTCSKMIVGWTNLNYQIRYGRPLPDFKVKPSAFSVYMADKDPLEGYRTNKIKVFQFFEDTGHWWLDFFVNKVNKLMRSEYKKYPKTVTNLIIDEINKATNSHYKLNSDERAIFAVLNKQLGVFSVTVPEQTVEVENRNSYVKLWYKEFGGVLNFKWTSEKGWKTQNPTGALKVKEYELIEGSAIGVGYYDNRWKGARIIKVKED